MGYKAEPRCNVTALVDIDSEKAEEFAGTHGFDANVYTDYEQMLSQEQPHIVSVCLWPKLHLPVTRACVEAGVKAVHCEKPMAPTWGESLEFGKLNDESDTQISFNHQRRFNHGYIQARELWNAGTFGELERIEMFAPMHLLDCGTHSLDLGIMMNHESPAVWVIGQVDARTTRPFFDVPGDFMSVGMMRFENGVRGSIHVGDDKEMGSGVRLTGSGGFMEITWAGTYPRAVVYDDPNWKAPPVDDSSPMPRVMKDMVDCLESGDEPELSVHKALRATEIIFAIYESSRSRCRIDLPLQTRDSAYISMIEEGMIGPQE